MMMMMMKNMRIKRDKDKDDTGVEHEGQKIRKIGFMKQDENNKRVKMMTKRQNKKRFKHEQVKNIILLMSKMAR